LDILSETEINHISSVDTVDMFEDLTDKYGESVYKFCRSLTYSKEDADDLFQETFAKIFEQPHKISGSDNPQTFIFSTALYIWKSWKRKYARRNRIAPVEPLDESVNVAANEAANIEEDYILREEIRMTRELVNALPEKFKTPVIMYYTMEMSVPDIAAAMKIPEGTVKSRLFKARKIIEKGLEDHFI
jgi:RNA polymerase sigma-70 factor (ECF subfamily)